MTYHVERKLLLDHTVLLWLSELSVLHALTLEGHGMLGGEVSTLLVALIVFDFNLFFCGLLVKVLSTAVIKCILIGTYAIEFTETGDEFLLFFEVCFW